MLQCHSLKMLISYQSFSLSKLFLMNADKLFRWGYYNFWWGKLYVERENFALAFIVSNIFCFIFCSRPNLWASEFLFVILLTDSFPHIKLAYLVLFSLFKLYSRYPLASSLWSLMCLCFLVCWIHHYLLVECFRYFVDLTHVVSY